MVFLHYKGRIHKGKFTARSVRYVLSDQAARFFPALQRRWLLPIDSQSIAEAASGVLPLPSVVVDAPTPACFAMLGISHPRPVQQTHHVYTVDDAVVTGWAGAMIKNGRLLTVRPQHNWVASLRAHPHRVRKLPSSRPYFNLMAPIPARGHIFHWLFDSIIPFMSFLESGGRTADPGLIVNADLSEIQKHTIGFLKARYGITAIEPTGPHEAIFVPHLQVAVATHFLPRGLQSPLGLALLSELGQFIAADAAFEETPKRIYVSRNDARLRRVLNEDAILPELEARGFKRVILAGMPISRQAGLFLNAEAVVAPHGAGLAHIAWCKPGTKIMEFFPNPDGPRGNARNATSNFWFISQERALDYRSYLAGPVETRADGFAIPEDLLVAALEESAITSRRKGDNPPRDLPSPRRLV